jgi:hypothetical protein
VRALRPIVPVLLLAAAAAVALLGADVRSWQRSLAAGDAVYAAQPGAATWSASTRLGGAAGSLLGVGDDVAARRALQSYRATVGLHARLDNAVQVQTLRARAEGELATMARSSDPRRAAQARTLLGVAALGAAATGSDQSQLEAAESDFTDALRVDPGYEPAAFDLELLLRDSAAHGVRPGQGLQGGNGPSGRHGAGGGVPGQGY